MRRDVFEGYEELWNLKTVALNISTMTRIVWKILSRHRTFLYTQSTSMHAIKWQNDGSGLPYLGLADYSRRENHCAAVLTIF